MSLTLGSIGSGKDGFVGVGNGIPRNSESFQDLTRGMLAASEKGATVSQTSAMAILNFSKSDLLQLLGLLEAELEARDMVIRSLKTERTKLLQSSSDHQQYTLINPYSALSRDKDGDSPVDGRKGPAADVVGTLQIMVEQHRKAEKQMRNQLEALRLSHAKVLRELDIERNKHAQETAHGDDVTYLLEKDRERLSQQVDFEKAQQKKMEKETKRAQSVLIEDRKKHMQVVKALLDEHRYLQHELAETCQRMENAECEAHASKVDAARAMNMHTEEKNKAEKREAQIERQLSEFDIEREQLMGKLKREENRTKQLRDQLDKASARLQELEHVLELSRDIKKGENEKDKVIQSVDKRGFPDGGSSVEKPSPQARPKSANFLNSPMPNTLNLSNSSKLFTPRGFKSQLKTENCGSSSSGSSEDLNSPISIKLSSSKLRGRSLFGGKKSSDESLSKSSGDETVVDAATPSNKPKVASVTPCRRMDNGFSNLSPASSSDKLNKPLGPSDSPSTARNTKIPAMTKKLVNIGIVSPQQSRKTAEASNPISNSNGTPDSRKQIVEQHQDSPVPSPLSRPTDLSSPAANKTRTTFVSAPDVKGDILSPIGNILSPTSVGNRISITFGPVSGSNIKAKAAQLTSPNLKRSTAIGSYTGMQSAPQNDGQLSPPFLKFQDSNCHDSKFVVEQKPVSVGPVSSSLVAQTSKTPLSTPLSINPISPPLRTVLSKAPMSVKIVSPPSTSLPSTHSCPTKPQSTTSKVVDGNKASTHNLSGTHGIFTKRTSPRSTPPPVPPNKPTITPFKPLPNTPSTSVTSPPVTSSSTSSSSSGSRSGTPPVSTTPSSSLKRSESLVEARKQFYARKTGVSGKSSVGVNSVNSSHTPNANFNNSNNHCSSSDANQRTHAMVLEIDVPARDCVSARPPGTHAKVGECALNGHRFAASGLIAGKCIPSQGVLSQNAVCNCMLPLEGHFNWELTPSPSILQWTSPMHQAALQGDSATLCRLIEERENPNIKDIDGSTPVYAAAIAGQYDCLKLLLDLGGSCCIAEDHGFTPLHAAAYEGHAQCCEQLVESRADVNCPDSEGWLPIHWAALRGHSDCVGILCDNGANLEALTKTKWTVFHLAAKLGQNNCLKLLLDFMQTKDINSNSSTEVKNGYGHTGSITKSLYPRCFLATPDSDSLTVAHILAASGNLEGLKILADSNVLNPVVQDQWRRTAIDVATKNCKEYLQAFSGKKVQVAIDLSKSSPTTEHLPFPKAAPKTDDKKQYIIGHIIILPDLSWTEFDQQVGLLLEVHCKELEMITREETKPEHSTESPEMDTLGLGLNSIHSFIAGNLHWSVGQGPSLSPTDLFKLTQEFTIQLKDSTNGAVDKMSYETLVPVHNLHNYVRLIEQYRRVIFYGPVGCGKSALILKLAVLLKFNQEQENIQSDITYIPLHARVTQTEFIKLLYNKGFLVPSSPTTSIPKVSSPILILDGMEKVTMADVFGNLLHIAEHSNSNQPIKVPNVGSSGSFMLHTNCIIIGCLDKARPGLDLTMQQDFRWIRLHWEQEPVLSMLTKHLLRKLTDKLQGNFAAVDDLTLKTVTWVCQVWHRFNEALIRLGLPDLVMGPRKFFPCPFDEYLVGSVTRWMCLLWNHSLAPSIEEAIQRGNMANSINVSAKQREKVANTALYVLLQKAVFPGCPIPDEDKEDYLSSFRGVTATLSQLSSTPEGNFKRNRRSKSLDRNRTSNKAAAMAKRQLLQEYAGIETNRNGRSFIPRRIISATSKSSNPSDAELTNQSTNSSKSIPSSPAEERDLLETLLQLNSARGECGIEELIQLQDKLFGQNNNRRSRYSVRSDVERHRNGKSEADPLNSRLSHRKSLGAIPSRSIANLKSPEEEVWSVWEETV